MITFICFSKDRPLQLHAYLKSLQTMLQGQTSIYVIYTVSDERYLAAYESLAAEFPSVTCLLQTDFCQQLIDVMSEAQYVCFGCDDVIFTQPVTVYEIEESLADETVFGFSLRLGLNITHNMFWGPLPQPSFQLMGFQNQFLRWNISDGTGDWAYPWEVLGTVYRGDLARSIVSSTIPPSPSQTEARGAEFWTQHTSAYAMVSCATSHLVVPTVNLVQSEFPNGICGTLPLDTEFLLDCWNHNLRVDTDRYAGVLTESWRIGNFFLTRI